MLKKFSTHFKSTELTIFCKINSIKFFSFDNFNKLSYKSWQNCSPNHSKGCPKSSHSCFYLKSNVFKKPIKSPYTWANFKRNFDAKNVQNSHNLVTLITNRYCKKSPHSTKGYAKFGLSQLV